MNRQTMFRFTPGWLTILALALVGWGLGPGPKAQAPKEPVSSGVKAPTVKMSPFDRESLLRWMEKGQARPFHPMEEFLDSKQIQTTRYSIVSVEFTSPEACQKFQAPGDHIMYRFDRFADLFIKNPAALARLEKHPDVVWIDVAIEGYVPPPERVVPGEKTRGKAEAIIHGGLDVPQTGKGVIIAVVDSGIDFHHPDFIMENGGQAESRLLYFWDTLADTSGQPDDLAIAADKLPPVRYPNGKPIGVIYTQAEMTAALAGKMTIPVWDTNGHGTACAGIAAGNGRGARGDVKEEKVGVGVAPEADLIAVRIGGAGRGFKHFFLLGAISEWVNKIARQRKEPYVLSCSFGGSLGPHDGNRVDERQLDAHFPLNAPGRAICISAGNDGDLDRHAEIQPGGKDAPGKLTWKSKTTHTNLLLYYDTKDVDDLVFEKNDVGQIKTYLHHLTGHAVTEADVLSKGPDWVQGWLSVSSKSGKKIKADAYLERGAAYFTGECVKYGKQIGTPASAKNAIAVGSYDWNGQFHRYGDFLDVQVDKDRNYLGSSLRPFKRTYKPLVVGELSNYSNPGPSRSGEIRPDIVAPGQWFTAAAASNIDDAYEYRDTTNRYRIFNGTSAACPYTAGVVALMMQKNPKITTGEIRELFRKLATKDDKTGSVPNPGWGNGKLDARAVRAILKAIP